MLFYITRIKSTDLIILQNLEKQLNITFSNKLGDYISYESDKLGNIIKLSLTNFNLDNFPNLITKLTNLKTLYLQDNQLQELPKSFGQLRNLSYLDLQDNQLQELPESFIQLKNLHYLDLRNNLGENLVHNTVK